MLMLFFCTLGLVGCDDDTEEGRKVTDYKEYVLTVASKRVPGVLWANGTNFLTEVYAVRKEQSDEWVPFGHIDGFEFEEGYEYQIKVGETSYLDYSMGQPAWEERQLLEVISREKKDAEDIPAHFIPATYYDAVPLPQYRYVADATEEGLIEKDLKENPLIPLDYHCMLYRDGNNFLRWMALRDDDTAAVGPYVIKTGSKTEEEMPESYKRLPPEGQVNGYGEWTFLDEAGEAAGNLSFDVFMGFAPQDKSAGNTANTIWLYKDLTEHYQAEYPEAGVKTVVVAYQLRLL